MHIRRCTTADRNGVIALWETLFPDDPPHNAPAEVFDARLAVRDGMLFVATDAEAVIVGTAMVGYDGHRGCMAGRIRRKSRHGFPPDHASHWREPCACPFC